MRSGRPSLWRAYSIPSLLALVSVIGLVAALVGDGPFDMLSWLLLGGLVMLIAVMLRR